MLGSVHQRVEWKQMQLAVADDDQIRIVGRLADWPYKTRKQGFGVIVTGRFALIAAR